MRTTVYPPKEIRLTIPVSSDVHDAFSRIAKAGNMPVGRAMGEWLGDTIDAAKFMADTMEKARAAPRLVAQELHAYALGLGDETGALIAKLREKGKTAAGAESVAGTRLRGGTTGEAASSPRTPPSNTGVTNHRKSPKRGVS